MKLIKKTTEDIPTDVHACSSNNADGVSSTTAQQHHRVVTEKQQKHRENIEPKS